MVAIDKSFADHRTAEICDEKAVWILLGMGDHGRAWYAAPQLNRVMQLSHNLADLATGDNLAPR